MEILASSLINDDLKLKPYLMQTIKQLTAIAFGFTAGFRAAGKSQVAAPIAAIERAYVNVYELKDYLPIIMHPNSIHGQLTHPTCYYSLSTEILHEGSLTTVHPPRIINKLREVKHLMEVASRCATNNPLLQIYQDDHIRYDYFHITEDREARIISSKNIPLFDNAVLETFYPYENRIFPAASPFMRGCISITNTSPILKKIKNLQKEEDVESVDN